MAKQEIKTATPKLRFPEFGENPQWPISKLGTRGRFLGGGTPSRENAEFWIGTHPWISSSDVSDEEIRPVRPSRFITDEAVAQSATQAVPAGSVLIVSRVGVGKIAVSEEQIHTSQDFANLVPSSDSPTFLAYLLKARKSSLLAFNQGMAIKGFTRDDIAGLEVPIPERPEQQKVVDCLTSLDEVIAAQGRKVEALKAHKRGLMRQLFPREGETRPRLRFPEFSNAPEWREEPVSGVISTVSPPQKIPTSCYQPQGRLAIVDQSPDPVCGWTDDLGARVNAPLPLVVFGDHTCVLKLIKHDFAQGADGIKIISAKSCIDIRFLFYALQADPIVSTSYRRHFSLLQQKKVGFPKGMDEQRRIADCLSSLDTRITAETNQLAALKAHKKGLMQQLFPATEGATP